MKSHKIQDIATTDSFVIIDPKRILTPEQKMEITTEQQLFYENHDCLVSYGFYGINNTQLEVTREWKERTATESDKFHIFVSIGVFLNNHNINIQYKKPPLLDDINEVDNILERASQSIQSKNSLVAVLDRSYVSINDELSYLSTRPKLEKDRSLEQDVAKDELLKEFILKCVKIGLMVIIPIVGLFVLWHFISSSKNKRPYRFPEAKPIVRLGAPSGASSVTQSQR